MAVADYGNQPPATPSGWKLRAAGAVLGAGLAGLAAAIARLIAMDGLAFVAYVGVPVGAFVGAIYAPRGIATDHPVRFAVGMSARAVLIGAAGLDLVIAFGFGGSMAFGQLGFGFLVLLIASLLYTPFGLVVALPVSLASVLLGRLMSRWQPVLIGVVLAAGVGAVIAANVAVAVATSVEPSTDGQGSSDRWLAQRFAQVRLHWVVENRSASDITFDLSHLNGADGWTGESTVIAACSITGADWATDAAWQLRIQPSESVDYPPPEFDPFSQPPDVSYRTAPGSDPRVLVVVDGSGRVEVSVVDGLPNPSTFGSIADCP